MTKRRALEGQNTADQANQLKLIAMAFKGTEKSIEKASDLLSCGAARVVMDSQVSKEEKV
jgi:hypothetical protein